MFPAGIFTFAGDGIETDKTTMADNIKDTRIAAALFDLDGVIVDTEGYYSDFWDRIGAGEFGYTHFGSSIKGQTLENIFSTYFSCRTDLQKKITDDIDVFEREMPYEYVPGVMDFIAELKAKGVPRAVVTSSNRKKMENVYARHPEFRSIFDRIFTGEDFARSKPAPDCYLLGMDIFGAAKKSTVIFEDSFSGLKSARDSGGFVVGLATTNSREAITPLADLVIDDFTGIDTERLLASMS